jgi:trigger factor
VTAQSVKVRELPEADDEFAEMASEFDTIEELKTDLAEQAKKDATGNLVAIARQALIEKLIADLGVPVPDQLLEDEIAGHLENEGKEPGDPHGEEIREDTLKAIQAQLLLDEINETREVEVGQADLMSYMTTMAAQYGMDPNQFLSMLAQSGQLESIFGEVQRSKALDVVLAEVTVKDQSGEVLEIDLGPEEADEDAAEDEATQDEADEEKAEA